MGTPYNFTISDTSSILSFTPYGDGNLTSGWQQYFSASGDGLHPACGDAGIGESKHYTAYNGASMALDFVGTAVYVYGSSNNTYQVSLDSDPTTHVPPSSDLLFFQENLPRVKHSLNLTVLASEGRQLHFDGAMITDAPPKGTGAPSPTVIDNSNTTVLSYAGSWQNTTDRNVPTRDNPQPFHYTLSSGSSVSINFTECMAISLNGSRNCGHGRYSVKLSDFNDGYEYNYEYNASTFWVIGDTLKFYQAGLDPMRQYQLQITNLDDLKFTLNYVTLYQLGNDTAASVPTSTHMRSKGSLCIGIIVGPVVAVAVIILLSVFLWLRRRKCRSRHRISLGGVVPFPTTQVPGDGMRQPSGFAGMTASGRQAHQKHFIDANAIGEDRHAPEDPQPDEPRPSREEDLTPPTRSNLADCPLPSMSSPPVDVNRIIELIAQRIDRPPDSHPLPPPTLSVPPPRYPKW
ncbi:unnamed protein product [Somion occarium]|uniref:Uncharacterized protein n=1 Tax=Somion occarium TaxID=3059160 RepID=A0ABP1CFE6_9APHY